MNTMRVFSGNEKMCKLDDGRILVYDMLASNPDLIIDPADWEFLGWGTIYRLYGVIQHDERHLRFFRAR